MTKMKWDDSVWLFLRVFSSAVKEGEPRDHTNHCYLFSYLINIAEIYLFVIPNYKLKFPQLIIKFHPE